MFSISKEELRTRLSTEFGYPPRGAELVADDILSLTPILQKEFEQWWKTGELPVLKIEAYTLQTLMTEYRMNPIAAMLTLNWLLRDPQAATGSLRRGHDRIINKL